MPRSRKSRSRSRITGGLRRLRWDEVRNRRSASRAAPSMSRKSPRSKAQPLIAYSSGMTRKLNEMLDRDKVVSREVHGFDSLWKVDVLKVGRSIDVVVWKGTREPYDAPPVYKSTVLKVNHADHVWFGQGSYNNATSSDWQDVGNSVLIVKGNTWYYVGERVVSWTTTDTVEKYWSTVGNSGAIMPYIKGKHYVYFPAACTGGVFKIPISEWQEPEDAGCFESDFSDILESVKVKFYR
jgi:hypothetical protein